MEELKLLGEKLIKNKYIFAEHIDLFQNDDIPFGDLIVREWRANLVEILGEALIHGKQQAEKKMNEAGLEIGRAMVESGESIDFAIENTTNSRNLFWSFIEEEVSNQKYSMKILLKAISIIDSLLDVSLQGISISFFNHYKETAELAIKSLQQIKDQQVVIKELSTPVVQTILQDVILIPLIGELDDYRINNLQLTVLEHCAKLNTESIIIDFTGISEQIVSPMLCQLDNLVRSLTLIGTEIIFVGFSPVVVRKIVENGIFSRVNTFLSFRQAMNYLLKKRGLAILPIS